MYEVGYCLSEGYFTGLQSQAVNVDWFILAWFVAQSCRLDQGLIFARSAVIRWTNPDPRWRDPHAYSVRYPKLAFSSFLGKWRLQQIHLRSECKAMAATLLVLKHNEHTSASLWIRRPHNKSFRLISIRQLKERLFFFFEFDKWAWVLRASFANAAALKRQFTQVSQAAWVVGDGRTHATQIRILVCVQVVSDIPAANELHIAVVAVICEL